MTERALNCYHVAEGDMTLVKCPDCDQQRAVTGMYGLTEEGPVLLGTMTSCRCGDLWRCTFCPVILPMDGASAYHHIAEAHAL